MNSPRTFRQHACVSAMALTAAAALTLGVAIPAGAATAAQGGTARPFAAESAAQGKRKPAPAPSSTITVTGPTTISQGEEVRFDVRFPAGMPLPDSMDWFTWTGSGSRGMSSSPGGRTVSGWATLPGRNTLTIDWQGQHVVTTVVTTYDPAAKIYVDGHGSASSPDGTWTASLDRISCDADAGSGRDCVSMIHLSGNYTTPRNRPVRDNQLLLSDGRQVPVDIAASQAYARYFAGAYDEGYHEGDCSGMIWAVYHLPPGAFPEALILRTSPTDPGVPLPIVQR